MSAVEHEFVASGCDSLRSQEISFQDPIGRRLLESEKPIMIANAMTCEEGGMEFAACMRAEAARLKVFSLINFPVIVKGLFRGVLCIQQTDRIRHWSDDETALVEAVAERLAIGIAQAELFEMVARGKQEWETTFDAMSDGIFIFDRD